MADVDKCEQDPDKAYIVNAMGPKNIAMACRDMKIKLIHISTDYVFDGEKKEPYTEFDPTGPVSVYGRSKLAGEEFVKMISDNFMIIRTAWLFGERRNHFVDYVINALKNGNEITAVKDMMSSPTYSRDVAEMIKKDAVHGTDGDIPRVQQGLLLEGRDGGGDNENNRQAGAYEHHEPEPVEKTRKKAGFFGAQELPSVADKRGRYAGLARRAEKIYKDKI